jgi:hypothetical protein
MILGALQWDDDFFSQLNNPSEALLKKKLKERGSYLETCGPSAAVNCLDAIGYNLTISCPGVFSPQPEEVLSDFFNDDRNYPAFRMIRKNLDPAKIPGNRVPQYYPYAVKQVFDAKAEYMWRKDWDYATGLLKDGNALQLCIPGHYISAQAFDLDKQEIIYDDSWKGAKKRMGRNRYERDIRKYMIIYFRRD